MRAGNAERTEFFDIVMALPLADARGPVTGVLASTSLLRHGLQGGVRAQDFIERHSRPNLENEQSPKLFSPVPLSTTMFRDHAVDRFRSDPIPFRERFAL